MGVIKIALLESKTLCLVGALALPSLAVELRPIATFLSPAKTTVNYTTKSATSQIEEDLDYGWQVGTELTLASEAMPIRYGLGIGFRSAYNQGSQQLAPATLPIWATALLGQQKENEWISPYVAIRGGWLAPLSTTKAWWTRPTNAIVQAGLGGWTLYGIGLELTYDYNYMLKRWDDTGNKAGLSTSRLAVSVSWGIGLGMERSFRPTGGPREIEEELQQEELE